MRALRALSIGVVMSMVVGAGVASAAPGQNEWDSGPSHFFDQCTGENVDGDFVAHVMSTADGPFHFNTHVVGVGETTGARYVGQNLDNEFYHALPDGNFMVDQVLSVRLQSQGGSANLTVILIHFHLVVDSDGNALSGFFDITQAVCQDS